MAVVGRYIVLVCTVSFSRRERLNVNSFGLFCSGVDSVVDCNQILIIDTPILRSKDQYEKNKKVITKKTYETFKARY